MFVLSCLKAVSRFAASDQHISEGCVIITYFGYDYFSPVLSHLTSREDITIKRIVSTQHDWGEHIRKIALRHSIPLITSRVEAETVAGFADDSDLVICASYSYKLPIPAVTSCVFLNIHPSLLPLGRGPAPIQWSLTSEAASAGVSIHVMDNDFDTGPIVKQKSLREFVGTSFENYTLILNQAAVELLETLNLNSLGDLRPTDQHHGVASYNPVMPIARRTIDSGNTCAQIVALIRAMGPLGAVVDIQNVRYKVTRVEAVPMDSRVLDVAYVNAFYGYYPCRDGYCLFSRAGLTEVV